MASLSAVRSTFLLCALAAGSVPASALAGPDPQPAAAQPAAAAKLERRIAELEAQIARLLKEVQSLRAELKGNTAPPVERGDIRVYPLKHASATDVVGKLTTLFAGSSMRLSADERTNNLLVHATRQQLEAIDALVNVLDVPSAAK
jgi:type II secretory pathway component GspD/PulD (secretin)